MKLAIQFLVLLFLSLTAFAEPKTITFVCDEWEKVANADGTGAYFDLIRKIYEPKYKVVFKTQPWAKAVADFKAKQYTALVSESRVKGLLHPDYQLDQSEITAIYKKGKIANFKGPDSLKGKKLGWVRDYGYDQLAPFKLEFTEVNNVPAGLKMLQADRFDVLLDYEADFPSNAKKAGVKETDFEMAPTGLFESTFIVFHDSAEGKELVKHYNEQMSQLLKSNEAQKIYEKYETPFPEMKM